MGEWVRGGWRWIAGGTAVAAVLIVVAAAAPAAGAKNLNTLGPAPGPCQPGQTSGCTFNSRCAQMSFSPHLVHVGDEISASAGPAVDACGPGGIPAISWSWGALPGVGVAGGPCRDTPLLRPGSCHWKATSSTNGWTIGCINGGSGFGPWMSCDYYAIIGAHERAISGRVLTKSGKPVNGATITIDGPTGGRVQTNSNGDYYADQLDPGHYTVSMRAEGTRDPAAFCSGHEHGGICDLDLTHTDGVADFTAPPDKLAMHFAPAEVPADGVAGFSGTIDVTDSAGQPAAGTEVAVAPPARRGSAHADLQRRQGRLPAGAVRRIGTRLSIHADHRRERPGAAHRLGRHRPRPRVHRSQRNGRQLGQGRGELPLTASGEHFPPLDGFAQLFYNAIRATQSSAKVQVFVHFNQHLTQPEGETQDLLLEWLIASGRPLFGGADFGPVSYAGHGGILFYPHGSTSPATGPSIVLDVRDAVAIANAAAAGEPIPAANAQARSLADWAMYVGNTHTPPPLAQTLGPLSPWTGQQYAYFGFPYPRSPLDTAGQARFYNACAAPDGTPQIVQTHSPVTLVFGAPDGTTFGLDTGGHVTGMGTGIVWRAGDVTTYMVPGGRYSTMSVTGTGNGTAHIEVFGVVGAPLTSYARKISSYVVGVHAGATGALPINFFGPAGAMTLAGRTVTPRVGLPLQLSGLPRRLRHGRRRLKLSVSSFSAPLAGALVSARYHSHQVQAVADARGRVSFTVKLPRGKLRITVTFPGGATLTDTVRVR